VKPLLEVALNGSRPLSDHPGIPRTPDQIAQEARGAVAAGAGAVHVHAFDDGVESLAAEPCASILRALREACPGIPISLTTSAEIEPDPERRFVLVSGWTDMPDLVTANMGEEGIVGLCEMLIERGVGIEAGLLELQDARVFVRSGLTNECVRVLVEPLEENPEDAVRHAAEMERVLAEAAISLEQVHHGDGIASWAVNQRALARGHGIRTGLEDTPVLPDGRRARNNADLVAAAATMISEQS
jgi:uncharacterized protein (DUF849 family)